MAEQAAERAAERAAELRARVRHHDQRHHVLDAPQTPDADCDRPLQDLPAIEAADPALRSADSPAQRVGGAVLAGTRYEHPQRDRRRRGAARCRG